MKMHPIVALYLPVGFTVIGLAEEAAELDPIFCCRMCTPFGFGRSRWERERVEVQRPTGMSRHTAQRCLNAAIKYAAKVRKDREDMEEAFHYDQYEGLGAF